MTVLWTKWWTDAGWKIILWPGLSRGTGNATSEWNKFYRKEGIAFVNFLTKGEHKRPLSFCSLKKKKRRRKVVFFWVWSLSIFIKEIEEWQMGSSKCWENLSGPERNKWKWRTKAYTGKRGVYGEEKRRRGRGGKVAPQKPRLFNLVLVKNEPMQQLFLRILWTKGMLYTDQNEGHTKKADLRVHWPDFNCKGIIKIPVEIITQTCHVIYVLISCFILQVLQLCSSTRPVVPKLWLCIRFSWGTFILPYVQSVPILTT